MPEKDQIFIFSAHELDLIKNVFADNDTLIYTIRKLFLQFELTDAEKGLIKTSVTQTVYDVLKKRILPDIAPEYPLGQLPSLLTTLTQDLKTKGPEDMEPHFMSKYKQITYLNERFAELRAIMEDQALPTPTINLTELAVLEDKDYREAFVDTNTYLFLLGYIDPMFLMIRTIAGAKDETPEEQKKRMMRDSNK